MSVSSSDLTHLQRDKYDGDVSADMTADIARLEKGEPLAYVIGWIPFLGLRIYLDSYPLIPRPETEYWVERLITYLREQYADNPFTFLDLCAGSGAIGLAILAAFPNAEVAFSELEPDHARTIVKNILENNLDTSRVRVYVGDVFESLPAKRFDCIATNPPYIPSERTLPASVSDFEPSRALFAGEQGMDVITRIINETPFHINPEGSLWMECDIDNIDASATMLNEYRTVVHNDQYGRPRYVVAFY